MLRSIIAFTTFLLLAIPALAQPKLTREQRVLDDYKKAAADGFYIYNDLAKGFEEAKKSGKPMFVIFRCVPCVECVKLDDDLVNQDQRVRPLLEKFVRVRVVSTNGLDLSLFQFDFDQSFTAFMLNGDGTIYGRFGTRSHRTSWAADVSIEGLSKALQGALDLHAQFPKNKDALAGKKGQPLEVASPEKFPNLQGKYQATIKFETGVVQSCIHCHQIGEAQRQFHRKADKSVPEQLIFSYPHPKSQGLILDPKEKATVQRVEKDTPADKAGFKEGDAILSLAGQPLLSFADVQWVLHQTPATGGAIKAEVQRGDKKVDLTLNLEKGWRQRDDISWRATSWELRRMGTGGMLIEELPAEERPKLGLADGGNVLRVKHVGQFGAHAVAKNAGFQVGDVILSFDGKTFTRETDLLAHATKDRKPGDKLPVELLRNRKKMTLTLPLPE